MSLRLRIATAGLCAVFAVIACVLYGSGVRAEADRARVQALERYGGEVVSLVVATRGIEAGEVISSSDVEREDWLASLAPQGAVTTLEDSVGREVTVPVAAGCPLNELNFRDTQKLVEIPSGCVALSVAVNDSLGLSTGVTAGTHVIAFRLLDDNVHIITDKALILSEVPTGSFAGSGSVSVAVPADTVSSVLMALASGELRLVVPADDVRDLAADQAGGDVKPKDEKSKGQHGNEDAAASEDGADEVVEDEEGIGQDV